MLPNTLSHKAPPRERKGCGGRERAWYLKRRPHLKTFKATTTGTPKRPAIWICFLRLLQPSATSSRFWGVGVDLGYTAAATFIYLAEAFMQNDVQLERRDRWAPGPLGVRALLWGPMVTSLCRPWALNRHPPDRRCSANPQSHVEVP